jgi:hypothetical protein
MRRSIPERLYQARRAERNHMLGQGVPEDRAETLLTAWEAEARTRGLDPARAAFWQTARGWIAGQRRRRAGG